MLELTQQGFHCSEVLLFMGLDAMGKENPDLIKAVSGLAGGIGFSGEVCGALTGGACLLGLYGGRGAADEEEDPKQNIKIQELVDWFSGKYGARYGGMRCREITGDDPRNVPERCPRLVASVYKKVRSLVGEDVFASPGRKSEKSLSGAVSRACPLKGR
jgi:C_GCAxxG_C_C family probable redox protein